MTRENGVFRTSGRENSLTRTAVSDLRSHREAALALPDPDTEFRSEELPDVARRSFKRFLNDGIIHRVGTDQRSGNTNRGIYRVDAAAAAYIAETLVDRPTLPCGHSGLHNCGGGEYECGEPTCEQRFDRETAEAVFGGGGGRDQGGAPADA